MLAGPRALKSPGKVFPCLLLAAAGDSSPGHALVCRHITLIPVSTVTWHSPYVSVSKFVSSYKDIFLTELHLQRPHFQIRSRSQIPDIRTSICLLGDTPPNLQHLPNTNGPCARLFLSRGTALPVHSVVMPH